MAKKDWQEIINKIDLNILNEFLNSNSSFFPSEEFLNPFSKDLTNFNSQNLQKGNPASWIPIYNKNHLNDFLLYNSLMPIRSGSGEFFFYKGSIFYYLNNIIFKSIDLSEIQQIENFVPLSLQVDFQKNENAFLNKAVNLGIINHFINKDDLKVLEKDLGNRLLYGQFGKIKTTFNLMFKTSKGVLEPSIHRVLNNMIIKCSNIFSSPY